MRGTRWKGRCRLCMPGECFRAIIESDTQKKTFHHENEAAATLVRELEETEDGRAEISSRMDF
jgi:hypothetical protein